MKKYLLRRLGVASDSGYQPLRLQDCLEAVLEQGDSVMDAVLSGLVASLVPVMGQKSAITLNNLARRTIESLNEQASAVKQSFSAHLRAAVFGGDAGPAQAPQMMRFDDFQFLDASQIDANIELAQSQQTVLMAVEEGLPALHAMISRLMGWSSVQGALNPIKPEAFVQALRATMERFVPDREARTTIMVLASGLLGVNLRNLYREIVDWLRSQGVEPVQMASTVATGLWTPGKPKESTVERTMLTLDRLRRLLSGELDPNPVAAERVDFAQTIPASLEALQDMKLVEPMMKRLAERAAQGAAVARPGALTDMLAPDAEQVDRKTMGEQLGREVILLMLENLMRDRRLLPPVRQSLHALEPVLIRLSQQDARFFTERHHPARLFLDRLTHRSLAFASVEAPGYARFQKYVDNAVSVLTGGAGDTAAFARIVRKLDEAWASEEAAQQQRAGEAARGLMRAEQRNLLAQRLSKQLAQRVDALQVPDFAAAFVRGPWAQVLAEAQLHQADGTVDPGGYMALVDDLLWSVQLRLIRHNRARLVQLVPDMLVTLRRGLQQISYPQARMTAFFDALIGFHEQAFDAAQTDAATPPATAKDGAVEAQTPAAEAFWVVPSEAAESGYLEVDALQSAAASGAAELARADRRVWSVESLVTGAWVDLVVGGAWVRAQLTWASPQRTLYLFITGGGNTHSASRQTLERMKSAGLIRMVSASRVLDNALDAVAQTALQNDLRMPPQ